MEMLDRAPSNSAPDNASNDAAVRARSPAASVDRDTFERMVNDHQESIRRLAFRLLGWRDGADDVIQEVFLSAWTHRDRFRGEASVELWLKRITVNKCRSRLRRQRVRMRWFGWLTTTSSPVPSQQRDENRVEQEERAGRVRLAIESLAPAYREVSVLHYLEQLTVDQIVPLVGARRNTVEVRLHRARRQLEVLLADLME